MRALFLLLVTISGFTCYGQDCPISGDSHNLKIMAADSLKNRTVVPERYQDVSIKHLLSMTISDDVPDNTGVAMQGYVLDIKNGGVESCNCHSKTNRDTHIYIVKYESITDPSQSVIVEVTPHFRQLGTTQELKAQYLHRYVTIKGYLFKDEEHKQNSSADHGKGKLWRGTTWEIHPVTQIILN